MASIGFFSYRQASKSTPDTVDAETISSVHNIQSEKTLANYNDKDVHTKYKYKTASEEVESNILMLMAKYIIQQLADKGLATYK